MALLCLSHELFNLSHSFLQGHRYGQNIYTRQGGPLFHSWTNFDPLPLCSKPWGVGGHRHETINNLKNGFYFSLIWLSKISSKLTTLLLINNVDHRLVTYRLWAKPILLLVFVNKVLLEHSPHICLHIVFDCFLIITAELISCKRSHMAHKD